MTYALINIANIRSVALRNRCRFLVYGFSALLLLFITFTDSFAQNCIRQIRRYADFQGKYETGTLVIWGGVTNDALAADNNAFTASTLSVPIGALNLGTATQFLEFTANGTHAGRELIQANTPVTIKFSVPKALAGVLSGVEIGSFTGLQPVSQNIFLGTGNNAGYNASAMTPVYTGASLLNALNGAGIVEVTVVPSLDFHGVYIKLGSLLSLGLSTDVYHAYIMKNVAANVNCEERVDILSGIRGNALANLASATGAVTNPMNTIDTDASLSTYSTMSTGAQVLGNVFQNVIFSTPSVAGDSVRVVVQSPGGGLLDLNLLTGFTIQPYLGTTPVGPALVNSPSFLNLRLLPGSSDKYIITAAIAGAFDRVEIIMGGVAAALATLRVYDISRIPHPPVTVFKLNAMPAPAAVCASQAGQVTLEVSGADSCTTYTWYDTNNNLAITGVAANGHSITPGITAAGSYTYTVKAARNGCSNTALQTPISYTIHPTPATPLIPPVEVCTGQSATLTVSNAEAGISYYWYSTASGGVPPAGAVSSGTSYTNTYTTGNAPSSATYHVAAYNAVTTCVSDSRGQGKVSIHPKPGKPGLDIYPN